MYSVTQICPTLLQAQGLYPIRLHGILQARILEQVAISSARGSSWPRDWLWVFLTFICNYSLYINILQARLQQYREQYCELPDVQTGFRIGRRTRDQISNICWIIKKAREFQKNIYFYFIDYVKTFDCVDHNKLWKILKEMGIPDRLTCLLRNLYAGLKATVSTGHGTTGWFQIGKGVRQGRILPPCLFNFYAEYIMRNAGLEEAQAGIKIAGRNISKSDIQMTPPLWQKAKKN